jgi:hypothetical protein
MLIAGADRAAHKGITLNQHIPQLCQTDEAEAKPYGQRQVKQADFVCRSGIRDGVVVLG